MTQDLFLSRPDDPLTYMRERLNDWASHGFRSDPKQEPPAVSEECIALGNAYLGKHNVRHLFVELGLRTLRQRPSDNPKGVRGFLSDLISKERASILLAVEYMLDPRRREREAEEARLKAEAKDRLLGAREAGKRRRAQDDEEFAFRIGMYVAKKAQAYRGGGGIEHFDMQASLYPSPIPPPSQRLDWLTL